MQVGEEDTGLENGWSGLIVSRNVIFFFAKHSTNIDAYIYAHILTPMNAHQSYSYKHL
jgi:hypothetical protein